MKKIFLFLFISLIISSNSTSLTRPGWLRWPSSDKPVRKEIKITPAELKTQKINNNTTKDNTAATESNRQKNVHLSKDIEIKFNGEKRPIMAWIMNALTLGQDKGNEESSYAKFSVTHNIEYKNDQFLNTKGISAL